MISYQQLEFERIVTDLFELMDYRFQKNKSKKELKEYYQINLENKNFILEIKFYRSKQIPVSWILDTANRLAYFVKQSGNQHGIIVSNILIDESLKKNILNEYGIMIWDRKIIYQNLTLLSLPTREEFKRLLLETQQGIEVTNVFHGLELPSIELTQIQSTDQPLNYKKIPINKGEKFCNELDLIPQDSSHWEEYELKCQEILYFLFQNDITHWEKHSRNSDDQQRYDLICRISSSDDYWKSLIKVYNSRFVLYSFFNQSTPLNSGDVYATKDALFQHALRTVCFIITRSNINKNAIEAAKKILKEEGKLIILLNDFDLKTMLQLKDDIDSPNDYLSNLLDNWLLSISL